MSERPEDGPAGRVVWSGEALGLSARVVAGLDACAVQARTAWPQRGPGPVWAAGDSIVERAALGQAVIALSARGALACYLLLEQEVALNDGTPEAEPLRDFMDKVWSRLLSEDDRAWLNARGHVDPGVAPVDGSKERR